MSRRFGRRWAVRRVSFEVRRGELVLVLGHNGAGKSTLLSLMAGLIRPTEGEITVAGRPLHGFPGRVLREQLGILRHEPFVYPELTGFENLTLMARLYGRPADRARVDAVLARLDLSLAAHRAARTYSRGMVQRLALGRLMLQDAALWLLDEPTTGLDAAGRALMVSLLGEARAAGRAIACVTHDPDLLAPVATRALTLVDGRLAADEVTLATLPTAAPVAAPVSAAPGPGGAP
ncbi:MAG: ABC transporter ATP-binding protein [Myxococcales bacterium]|nr:ABC transporter ATP-binding protein [Myxococcales bacterium]